MDYSVMQMGRNAIQIGNVNRYEEYTDCTRQCGGLDEVWSLGEGRDRSRSSGLDALEIGPPATTLLIFP